MQDLGLRQTHNAQPWRFIIIIDKNAKRNLVEAMSKAWIEDLKIDDPNNEVNHIESARLSSERFTSAPLLILACLTIKEMISFPDEKRQQCERDLAVQSLAAAVQNMLLALEAEGLGACWYCAPIFCKAAVQKTLKIPDEVEPQGLLTVGYPDENPKMPNRKPLKDIAYLDSWGSLLRFS